MNDLYGEAIEAVDRVWFVQSVELSEKSFLRAFLVSP